MFHLTERRLHRRRLLTFAAGGLGSLALAGGGAGLARAEQLRAAITGKSVIFVFQQGGPSQFETLDPKPLAADSIRTVTGTVATTLPGVRLGDSLPRLARLADRLSIVRSFQTGNAGHNIQPLVGPDSLDANIGVHYSRVAGATRSDTGMPTGAVLFPSSVDPDVPRPEARGDLAATGPYAPGFAPFIPGSGGQLQQDMELSLPDVRVFQQRRPLLKSLDRLNRRLDSDGRLETADQLQRQAFELLRDGGVARALDLSREDPGTLARYDTSYLARPGAWDKVARGRRGYYTAQAQTLGKLLLLARRLCEAGCGFVTVHAGYAGVWDMHADGNNLNMRDGMEAVGRSFDHAMAALIQDLHLRGLEDQILVVACGEMGRTPRLNAKGGRDHWAKLAPLLLAGAGRSGNQIIGQSTPDGGEPASEPLTPRHLIATILHTLFDVGQLRLVAGLPPEVLRLAAAAPLPIA